MVAACSESEDVSRGAGTISTQLQCEEYGFPCTWDEVPTETVTRTLDLGEIAVLYNLGGSSMQQVAEFLQDQPEIDFVQVIGTGVQYRLEGGRPAWVYPKDELRHAAPTGRPSTSGSFAPGTDRHASLLYQVGDWLGPAEAFADSGPGAQNRGVAAEETGTGKKALIISPYEFEWIRDRTSIRGQDMARRAGIIRDYKKKNRGEVVYHANLHPALSNPVDPEGPQEVMFSDFLTWRDYNMIVLLSHGTEVRCDRPPPVGGAKAVAWSGSEPAGSERVDTDWCPQIFAGRASQSDYGSYVGVEIYTSGAHVLSDHPGLTRIEAGICARLLAERDKAIADDVEFIPPYPETDGGKPCRLSELRKTQTLTLWTPFFESEYGEGLENTILFLAACRSGINDVFLNLFAPEGNKNVAVMGFDDAVSAEDGFAVAYEMIDLVGQGLDSQKVLEELREFDRRKTHHFVGRSLDPGDDPLPAEPAEIVDSGDDLTHGRDIVLLVKPGSGKELEHGDTLRVVKGDEEDEDDLAVHPQLIGLSEQEVTEDYQLQVRVVGESVPDKKYFPETSVSDKVLRHAHDVTLGRKHVADEIVDLEVRLDLPGGGDSRWIYRDIKLSSVGCQWSASVSGATAATGELSGETGRAWSVNADWPPIKIDAVVQDGDLQPGSPWLRISMSNLDRSRRRDPSHIDEIRFAIPGVKPGDTGSFNRVWGSLTAGGVSHDGNAEFLRRNVIGLPGGTGIGHLLTSSVHLTLNDDERVEGSFEASFLNKREWLQLGPYEQRPPGVGVHALTDVAIKARGEFSLLKGKGCNTGSAVKRMEVNR